MKKRVYKIFVVSFLVQFLGWMHLGATQLYCQCNHSIAEEACHVSQDKIANDDCCANPATSKTEDKHNKTAMGCPEMAMEDTGAKESSCCLNDNEAAIAYSSSAHFCQTACVSVVTTHSKQMVVPDPGKKMPPPPLLQKFDARKFSASASLLHATFHELEISPHSPPLFLLNSSFLI